MAIYMQYKMQKAIGQIYGASWDGSSSTRWTRTDAATLLADPNPAVNNGTGSSPFDYIMPWAGMVRVSDENAGELVAIPKFYFKLDYANATEPRGLKIQISMVPHTGFLCSPAHMDRGDGVGERDVIYVGRYHCATGTTNKYKSVTGVLPLASETIANFRSGIHNLGSTIWQWDYATLVTIWMLFLVEFADWDSQKVVGMGCSPNNSIFNMGLTDSMQYHTGTTEASRSSYSCTQYRNIEGLWDNISDGVDGIRFYNSNIYAFLNPSSFHESEGGQLIDFNRPVTSNYIKSWAISDVSGYKWFIYPNSVGNDTNYTNEYHNYGNDYRSLHSGSSWHNGTAAGLFHCAGSDGVTTSLTHLGSRLMKLP